MESRLHQRLPQPQNQQNQINPGLIRYRSAPSSYFTTLMDRELCEQSFGRPSSLEPEPNFTPFPSSGIGITESLQNFSAIQWNSPVSEAEAINNQQETNVNNYISASPRFLHSPSKPPFPNQSINSGFEEDYSTGMDRFPSMRTGSGRMCNLIRHSSLPPGLLSDVNIQSGISAVRGMASYGGANENSEVEPSFPTSGRSKNFSSRTPFGPMISIAELEDKPVVLNEDLSEGCLSGFENSSWDDFPADQSNNITVVKGYEEDDDDVKLYSSFSSSDTQNVDAGNHLPRLAHQLSLPNTSAEMNAIENFLQFSDSVPCKIRAKRGCATHPRSIAERVRRTRISERMKKLQDLVPNMEKQTNTADMLELAVEYIKDLQKQVQALCDNRAKCSCSKRTSIMS